MTLNKQQEDQRLQVLLMVWTKWLHSLQALAPKTRMQRSLGPAASTSNQRTNLSKSSSWIGQRGYIALPQGPPCSDAWGQDLEQATRGSTIASPPHGLDKRDTLPCPNDPHAATPRARSLNKQREDQRLQVLLMVWTKGIHCLVLMTRMQRRLGPGA